MIIRDNFLLILHKNVCCDPSTEPSRRDGSDEASQHMVSMRNKKNYPSIIIKYPLLSRALQITLKMEGISCFHIKEHELVSD